MRRVLLALAAVALFLPSPVRATDANLDPTFASYGWLSVDPTPDFDEGNDVTVQPDGKIVVVGAGFSVYRYTAAGSPDGAFGAGGSVTTSVGSGGVASGVALQGDGKIVVTGAGEIAAGDPCMVVVRYDSSGALDPIFGTGGIAKIDLDTGSTPEFAHAVTIDGSGRILVVGYDQPANIARLKLVRLLATGALDPTFGTGGVATLALTGSTFGQDLALQSDGKIVVGGYSYVTSGSANIQAFLVARFDSGGSLDAGFGAGGKIVNGPGVEGSRVVNAVAIQPDGKILAGGFAGAHPAVLRYLTNGSPDGAFATGGLAETTFENFDFAGMQDMVLRPDGRIVLVGSVHRDNYINVDTGIVRFNGDGSIDNTFGTNGHARIVIGPRQSAGEAAALQADGKIVVTGYAANYGPTDLSLNTALYVARFGGTCGDGVLDAGEQCDDGNTDGHDCCAAGCGFDPAGQTCDTGDASVCTYDTCDGAGTCVVGGPWPASECLSLPQPLKAKLAIRDDPTNAHDAISFKWTKGPTFFSFANPTLNSYSMCVFGNGALASENVIPPGIGWSLNSKGYKLKRDPLATPGGIKSVILQEGVVPKSKVVVVGKGPFLGAAAVPLALPVKAQLVTPAGLCFDATFTTPSRNADGHFVAKGQ